MIFGIKNVLNEQRKFYEQLYAESKTFLDSEFEDFTSSLHGPKVTDIDYKMLEQDFSLHELKEAVFKSKREKVAGSDGICTEFYQTFFNVIKFLLLDICRIAAVKGLHTTAKQGIISLIEKSNKNLDLLDSWRPLSLLNCDGKFYAKMLALRLEKITPYLIHSDQSGFQRNRSIQDNLFDLVSVLDYVKEKQDKYLLISFDFQKAFDKVNWQYLDAAMKFFGIGEKFRKMIQNAHEDTKSCTVNGGFSSNYIDIRQGLRQGSPLSPALFNIAVEILSIAIRQNENIEGLKIGIKMKKHGQYADDIWTIVKADQNNYSALLDLFERFAKVSGLQINYDKSKVLRIGKSETEELKSDKPLIWTNTMKILGITVKADRTEMLAENYQNLVDKIKKTLDPWRARTMTLAGKIIIINTLVMSQSVYKVLTLGSPTKKTIQKIKKLVSEFLWDSKKAKVAYGTLVKELKAGGLKLVDFATKNESLKCTWIKKALSTENENIWKTIADELLPTKLINLIETNLDVKDIPKLKIKEDWNITAVLKAWCKVQYYIPKSKNEVLRQHLWFNSKIRKKNIPYCLRELQNKGVEKLYQVYNERDKCFYSAEEMTQMYGITNFLQYYQLIKDIPSEWKKMLINETRGEDRREMLEIVENNQKVSSKLYWEMINKQGDSYDHGYVTWQVELKVKWDLETWHKIREHGFRITLSTKHRIFQFKILSKKLVTNVMRHRWDANIAPECDFCKKYKETTLHLMWECHIVAKFWKNLIRWCKYICNIEIILDEETIITNMYKGYDKRFIDMLLLTAKQYIYATKCLKETLNINKFITRVNTIYVSEKEIAFQTNKISIFKRKWLSYEKGMKM